MVEKISFFGFFSVFVGMLGRKNKIRVPNNETHPITIKSALVPSFVKYIKITLETTLPLNKIIKNK